MRWCEGLVYIVRVKLCGEQPLVRLRGVRHMDIMTLDLWSLKRKRDWRETSESEGGEETVFVFWMFPGSAMRPWSESTLVKDLPFRAGNLRSEIDQICSKPSVFRLQLIRIETWKMKTSIHSWIHNLKGTLCFKEVILRFFFSRKEQLGEGK
jgi:hypothetical protein